MRVSYSPGYDAPLPDNHIFPMKKFTGLYRYLIDNSIVKSQHVISPVEAEDMHLRLVHSERYTNDISAGTLTRKEVRRLGLPWSQQLARRSRLAVSGTVNAAMMALQDGISGNLAGGTHHAFPDHGEGFCVFNDVAVAIRVLHISALIKRAMIIDCDVHQGNGNAAFFRNDTNVFTFSMHGENNYPLRKPPSSYDVSLPDKTGDGGYISRLEQSLDHIFSLFTPDIVFYLGGIDILKDDRFGRLSVSRNGLIAREQTIIEFVWNRHIPLVLLLSGGYAPTVEKTVKAHAHMFRIGGRHA